MKQKKQKNRIVAMMNEFY